MPEEAKRAGPRLRHPALLAGGVAGTVIYVALRSATPGMEPMLSFLLSWDAAVLVVFIALILRLRNATQDDMKDIAASQDAGKWAVLVLSLTAATASLVAIAAEMPAARNATGIREAGLALFIICTSILSWAFIHTIFALHYAHDFYLDSAVRPSRRTVGPRGLIFLGNHPPAYGDFLYFSFTIGMTFQVSDVQIADPGVRRLALVHAIVSFFFATGILAMSINLVASLVR